MPHELQLRALLEAKGLFLDSPAHVVKTPVGVATAVSKDALWDSIKPMANPFMTVGDVVNILKEDN